MSDLPGRFRAVRAAELALLDPHVRRDAARVDELLHPDFSEIGRSGRLWNRAEIIAALGREEGRIVPEADEWAFDAVAPDLVLVTYRLRTQGGTSRHASLWDVGGSSPRIRFHQGTVLPTKHADGAGEQSPS